MTARSNPFSGARFAPGVLPWIETTPNEIDHWLTHALTGTFGGTKNQILGPHGSGKSTLLIHLERRARLRSFTTLRVRGSQCSWPALIMNEPRVDLLLIDEVEELGRLAAQKASLLARWLHARALVVSTHRDLGFVTLTRRSVDAGLTAALVRRLSPATSVPDLDQLLERHGRNLREVFFELYDRVESASARPIASSKEASSLVTGGSKSAGDTATL